MLDTKLHDIGILEGRVHGNPKKKITLYFHMYSPMSNRRPLSDFCRSSF